jgi:hypothetical protein
MPGYLFDVIHYSGNVREDVSGFSLKDITEPGIRGIDTIRIVYKSLPCGGNGLNLRSRLKLISYVMQGRIH